MCSQNKKLDKEELRGLIQDNITQNFAILRKQPATAEIAGFTGLN